jgi:hypothetical protein
MSEGNGIDMEHSGWTNPEGFVPRKRDSTPAPVVPDVCGDVGPGGFVCELSPGHAASVPPGHTFAVHKADDGSPEGVVWRQSMIDVGTYGEPDQVMPGPVKELVASVSMATIHEIAERALSSDRAADWAVGLAEISRLTD